MSHTPGPWDWKDGLQLTVGLDGDPEGRPIAHLVDRGAESFPNARLIAAAPDLLAALQELLPLAEAMHEVPPTRANMARAAIDKATQNRFPAATWVKGTPVAARDGGTIGHSTGATKLCQLHGCTGMRIGVRWPDGKLTWPCTKGMGFDGERWLIK